MRVYAALLLSLSMAALAAAGEVQKGFVTVAFGKTKTPDGRVIDLTGMKLPFTAERINAKKITPSLGSFTAYADFLRAARESRKAFQNRALKPGAGKGAPPAASGPEALLTIYQCDQGAAGSTDPYGVIGDFPSCSILDDLVVDSSHSLKPWKTLTFGFTAPDDEQFLLHWTSFESYTSGRGVGVSAVDPFPIPSNYVNDFGVWWPGGTGMGYWKVEIDVSAAAVYTPGTEFWFAERMRTLPLPYAPFDTAVQCIFSPALPPQVGTSSPYFWLDWDPEPDGVYDETEVDTFGDSQNPTGGNLLLKMTRSSTSTTVTVVPLIHTMTNGKIMSGDVTDVQFSDDFWLRIRPDYERPPDTISMYFEGTSPTASPVGIGVNVEGAAVTTTPISVDMYRYRGASPGWVTVMSSVNVGTTDTPLIYFWTAGNPENFVDATTRKMRTRIRSNVPRINARNRTWNMRFDEVTWSVVRP